MDAKQKEAAEKLADAAIAEILEHLGAVARLGSSSERAAALNAIRRAAHKNHPSAKRAKEILTSLELGLN